MATKKKTKNENQLKEIINNKAVRFYLILAIFVFLILLVRDFSVGIDNVDWDGIWTEAHGMWFDIIILGFLLAIYDHFRDKKENEERARYQKEELIRAYQDQIKDFRGWQEVEATYRIVGNIRRLNKLGISRIDLISCYLREANLTGINLEGAEMWSANLNEAFAWNCNFKNANMKGVDIRGLCPMVMGPNRKDKMLADFRGTQLEEAKAYEFQRLQLIECGADEEEIQKMKFYPNPDNLIQNKWGIWIIDRNHEE